MQCPSDPVIEELSREVRALILPEALEVLAKQVGLDRVQVEFEQLSQPDRLLLGEILRALQQQPTTAFENIFLPVGFELLDLVAPDLIDRLAESPHDMEAIEDIQRLRGLLGDALEIRGPHIAAHELDLGAALFAELLEKAQQRFRPTLGAAPQKPSYPGVELVDQGQILVPLEDLDLINADLHDAVKVSVGQAVIDDKLDGPEDGVPTGLEDIGGLLPREPLRPAGQKELVGEGHSLLAIAPGQRLYFHAAGRTVQPARCIAEVSLKGPDRQIFKQTLPLPIVHVAPLPALGADRAAIAAWFNVNDQGFHSANELDANGAVNKRLEPFDLVQ